ncbi:hypothetical protein FHS82_000125 [Pseudochelatococcus lubricantis]|uniref:Uncharacterized protein n=1 Tax=Pseudochelatococcus lubricantis TaxID=1538102 RepID=A0ABX0UTM7_9HYPH|nr:hypothetical protein [Pseudochelatococcus lubricantis]NIJ56312.1 hypothetical protein [Pseudochelatococcus lubricantis]
MSDATSQNPQNGAQEPLALTFHAEVGEGDQVLLKARSPHAETALPLTSAQAAHLGRALLTAAVATHAGASRPVAGTPVDDCQFPVLRWIAARSSRNGFPLVTVILPGNVSLTLQLDDSSTVKCGESLIRLAQRGAEDANGTQDGGLPPII